VNIIALDVAGCGNCSHWRSLPDLISLSYRQWNRRFVLRTAAAPHNQYEEGDGERLTVFLQCKMSLLAHSGQSNRSRECPLLE
jgi:hypothetical protein